MKIFYDPKTGGFLREGIHDPIPDGSVYVTEDRYAELMAANAEGKWIVPGKKGAPSLQDAPPATDDQIRAYRSAAYRLESDPLKTEAEYDAILSGSNPDYTSWMEKVAEIKARYPLPAE